MALTKDTRRPGIQWPDRPTSIPRRADEFRAPMQDAELPRYGTSSRSRLSILTLAFLVASVLVLFSVALL